MTSLFTRLNGALMAATWVERFGILKDWCKVCPVCGGTAFLRTTAEAALSPFSDADQPRCACWYLYVSMQVLWLGGFPKGNLPLNFDSVFPLTTVVDDVWQKVFPDSYAWEMSGEDQAALRFWTENAATTAAHGLSCVLFGDKGTGKSALATALAKEFAKRQGIDVCGIKKNFSARWLVADSLYEDMGKGWRAKDLLGPCMQADLLVIDDLRMAYRGIQATEYVERMHSLLQYRAGNNLSTLITTNKIAQGQDYESNAITEFLGVVRDEIPQRFGKYRYIRLTNMALRPSSEWGC